MITQDKQPGELLKWDNCEFLTFRKAGLKIHKSKKPYIIEHHDYNDSDKEGNYAESDWERDYIGTSYQTF